MYTFDTTTDTQEYDFLALSAAPVSFEELLFGSSSQMDFLPVNDELLDYSAIEPIPYVRPNPVCCKTQFRDFEHLSNLSCTMPYAGQDTQLAQELQSRIEQDYASIQCESEAVRDLLLSTYPNPYSNLFDVSVQEKSHQDEDKHLYRYTCGRKDDVYSSVWYRNLIGGNERDGGERYCAPCNQWHNTRNHSWANHMTSVHGISAVTKTVYPFPSGVIFDSKTRKLKGWCPKCREFVLLYIKKVGTVWTTWFRHQDAHVRKEMQDRRGGKIHTPNNPRNSKKRAIEFVEPEVQQSSQSSQSSSVDVSAANNVLGVMNKKLCDWQLTEQFDTQAFDTQIIETQAVEVHTVETQTFETQVFETQTETQAFDSQTEPLANEALVYETQNQLIEQPVYTTELYTEPEMVHTSEAVIEPVESTEPAQTDSSDSADYSVNQVQDMMDLLEMEMEITMELGNEDEDEDEETTIENSNEDSIEDSNEDTVNEDTNTTNNTTNNTEEDSDSDSDSESDSDQDTITPQVTSPEDNLEFKHNPFEGDFDNYNGLFGDYNF